MAKWGMDVENVREFGKLAEKKAQELEDVATKLKGLLSGVNWTGPDADKFRQAWTGTHEKNLKQIAEGLRKVSKSAIANANQQETVSRA